MVVWTPSVCRNPAQTDDEPPGAPPGQRMVCLENWKGTIQCAGVEGAGVEGAGVEGAGVEGAGVEGAGVEGAGVEGAGVEGAGVEGQYQQDNNKCVERKQVHTR